MSQLFFIMTCLTYLSHLCHVKNYIVSVSKALNCSSYFEEIPGSFVAERDSVQTRLFIKRKPRPAGSKRPSGDRAPACPGADPRPAPVLAPFTCQHCGEPPRTAGRRGTGPWASAGGDPACGLLPGHHQPAGAQRPSGLQGTEILGEGRGKDDAPESRGEHAAEGMTLLETHGEQIWGTLGAFP